MTYPNLQSRNTTGGFLWGDDFILVDARDEVDRDSGRIPKATNIPNVLANPLAKQARENQLKLLPMIN